MIILDLMEQAPVSRTIAARSGVQGLLDEHMPSHESRGGRRTGTKITKKFDQRAIDRIPDVWRIKPLARLTATVPTGQIVNMLRLDTGGGNAWSHRLINGYDNLPSISPSTKLHVDIFESTPIKAATTQLWVDLANYAADAYSYKHWPYMATFVLAPNLRDSLAKKLGLPLNRLYQTAGLSDSLAFKQPDRYKVLVYLLLPISTRGALLHPSVARLARFGLDGAALTDRHDTQVRQIAQEITRSRSRKASRRIVRATIIGHADERGTKAYNHRLGLRRAQAASNRLAAHLRTEGQRAGIAATDLEIRTASEGEAKPASKTDHELNRRVELVLEAQWATPTRPLPLDMVLPRLTRLVKERTALHPDERAELLCVLSKIPTSDSRYATSGVVFAAYLGRKPIWSSLSLRLTHPNAFGKAVPDEQVLDNYRKLHNSIRGGIAETHKLRYTSGGTASTELRATMRRIGRRAKDRKDIYSCF